MSYNTPKYNQYIINAITPEGYGVDPKTDSEKLKFLSDTFISEYSYMIERVGFQKALEEWLMGLPSSISLEFENYKILEFVRSMGDLGEHASEKEEDLILNNYWRFMANKIYKLIKPNYNSKLN